MIELPLGDNRKVVIACSGDFRLQTGTEEQRKGEIRVVLDKPGDVTFTIVKAEAEDALPET